jgi:hypothetical protein
VGDGVLDRLGDPGLVVGMDVLAEPARARLSVSAMKPRPSSARISVQSGLMR